MQEDRAARAEEEAVLHGTHPATAAGEEPSRRTEDESPARRRDGASPVGIDEVVRRPVAQGGREPPEEGPPPRQPAAQSPEDGGAHRPRACEDARPRMAEEDLARRENEPLGGGVLRHVRRPHENVERLEKIGRRRRRVREAPVGERIRREQVRELVVDPGKRDRVDREECEPEGHREGGEACREACVLVTSLPVTLDEGLRGAQARLLERALFLAILLRLFATVFLVPPFSGFDEPYHLGLVVSCRDRVAFPDFLAPVPPDVVEDVRRWPLPPAYAAEFSGTPWGATPGGLPRPAPSLENYEVQQAPLFYVLAGRIAALVPARSATALLYLFRSLNAMGAFAIALLARRLAQALGFGERSWLPLAFLAFAPGFALALARASNDALAALLMSLAVVGSLRSGGPTLAVAIGAGLAPAAKLYAWAALAVPAALACARKSARALGTAAALILPGAAVAVWAWLRHGSPLPLQENLRPIASASLSEVPWLRDAWTVAKTHVWVSGMGFHVFANPVHIGALLVLLGGVALSLAAVWRAPELRRPAALLAIPLALFGTALAYHAWRNFSYFRDSGGTGGWYLWAMALPEALLLTLGLSRRTRLTGLVTGLALFLALSVAGDAALFLEGTGALLEKGAHHRISGIADLPARILFERFLASRPQPAAFLALALVPLSWCAGLFAALSVRRFARPARP